VTSGSRLDSIPIKHNQYSHKDGGKFNLAGFEPVGKKFQITSPSLFGTNIKCSQFLNHCLLGIDLGSRSPTHLDSEPGSSRQSFLSIALPGFQETLGPRCRVLLHTFLTFVHSCAQVSWVLALYVLPEGAEKKLEVSQFFFVPFQATRRFRVKLSPSTVSASLLQDLYQ